MRNSAIAIQSRVVSAVILRDVKTRFGGNPVNYLVALAWPLAHIAVLITIYTAAGRTAPYGTSSIQFFATGVLPVMLFNYPARFVMMAVATNLPLLGFPIVTLFDLIFARVILEMVTGVAVVVVCGFTLFALGVDMIPKDPPEAVLALLSVLLMSAGVGTINALITRRLVGWPIAFILVTVVIYITSGAMFLVDALPEKLRYVLSFNPIVHGVSWFRSAYYDGYGELHLSKQYLVLFGLASLMIGLFAERLLRRVILSA